ncbi:MAG: FecR domain-containing protein [Planctomycetota bacterium]
MSSFEELARLVSSLVDHVLAEAEASRLNEILLESKQARLRYHALLDNHEALCAIYPGDVFDACLGIADDADETSRVPASLERASSRAPVWLPWLASVATILIAIGVYWSRSNGVGDAASEPVRSSAPVARLISAVDVKWHDAQRLQGRFLTVGGFQLDSGEVELEFNLGARVSIQGPARFVVKGADRLHVYSGSLVARIPEEALGFTISTDEAEVVDLGTEFGLSVSDNGQTEVHVIEGLVEVYHRDEANARAGQSIQVEEGHAIRLELSHSEGWRPEKIPARSSAGLVDSRGSSLGLAFLQGNIRLKESVAANDLQEPATSWIEVIPESSHVLLSEPMPVTLTTAGNHRLFGDLGRSIPAGTWVDSYLFHFRSGQSAPVRGAIKFDRKIVGLICEADQLADSDPIVGRKGVTYPVASQRYRGLEPRGPMQNASEHKGGGWLADEVTISQDMKTLGLSVNVQPVQGVDQLRVLVMSSDR